MLKRFLLLFVALWALTRAEANADCRADFDGNGEVDFADFLLFSGQFGQGGEKCTIPVDADSLAVVMGLRDSISTLQAALGATRFTVTTMQSTITDLQNALASETERANENQRRLTASNDAFNSLSQSCTESEAAAQPEPEPPVVIEPEPQPGPQPEPEPEPPQPVPVETRADSAKRAYQAFYEAQKGYGNPRNCQWLGATPEGEYPWMPHLANGDWNALKPEVRQAWENGIWGAADYNAAHDHNGGGLFEPSTDPIRKKRILGFLYRFTRTSGYSHTCEWLNPSIRYGGTYGQLDASVKTYLNKALDAVFGAE